MNAENNNTTEVYKVRRNLADKMDLQRGTWRFPLSELSIYYTWKNIKSRIETINLKHQEQHGMKRLISFYADN